MLTCGTNQLFLGARRVVVEDSSRREAFPADYPFHRFRDSSSLIVLPYRCD